MRKRVGRAAGWGGGVAPGGGLRYLVLSCWTVLACLAGCYQTQALVAEPDDAGRADAPEAEGGDDSDAEGDAGADTDAEPDTGDAGGDDGADEGSCLPAADEVCDWLDNDCDTETDEGFELATDPWNCGSCGAICAGLVHATPACRGGFCFLVCEPGWVDANSSPIDGCEYFCAPTAVREDAADGSCWDELDNDCDVRADCYDADCECGCVPEVCNGVDDDCDGLTDEGCGPECCTDRVDNDRDGAADCEDADCLGVPACAACREGPEICWDDCDNDLDCRTDGDDAEDCPCPHACGRCDCPPGPEQCDDSCDDDRDGAIDCEDSDCGSVGRCAGCVPTAAAEDTFARCTNGRDDDCDGWTDCCDEPTCARMTPGCDVGWAEECGNGLDDDLDGMTDCSDWECRCWIGCTGIEWAPEDCGNEVDDDWDGRTDAEDFDCPVACS